jgi:hypothetical protein
VFPNDLQAFGNNLAATAAIAGALVWHILHPALDGAVSSVSAADGPLQPEIKKNP